MALNNTFAAVNDEWIPTPPTYDPAAFRRPGITGLVGVAGHQGRIFVAPRTDRRRAYEFNGAPATEPIRAYAGLDSADDIYATAEMAARELQRTGGFDRRSWSLRPRPARAGSTKPWRPGVHVQRRHGDRRLQYSFLPSWISFLVDKENATQAGQTLFEAVENSSRDARGTTPRLLVFGESLGSFGGEAPFLALNNLVARTDGALFSGPTFNNTIWTELTGKRDKGSPMWLPIYDDGYNARFVARPENLTAPTSRGPKPARSTCSTHPTRSPGGHRICYSANRIGSGNRAATTCHRG